MKKVISFEQVNEGAAGIDIDSEIFFVSPRWHGGREFWYLHQRISSMH